MTHREDHATLNDLLSWSFCFTGNRKLLSNSWRGKRYVKDTTFVISLCNLWRFFNWGNIYFLVGIDAVFIWILALQHFILYTGEGSLWYLLLSKLFLPQSMCRELYLRKMMLPRLKFGENMEFLWGLNYLVLSIKYFKLEMGNLYVLWVFPTASK